MSMDGKVVVITGGNDGIGFETAVDLGKRGARLIIGCQRSQNVVSRFQHRVSDAKIDVLKLDLSSKVSIHQFAMEVRAKYKSVNVLINNAEMKNGKDGPTPRQEAHSGFELVMATNYLGHALLNHLLMDLLIKGAEESRSYSRLILVSSISMVGREALDLIKNYNVNFDVNEEIKDARHQYGKSKLAQIMYASHLAETMKEKKCKVVVTSLHPGFVRTDIMSGIPAQYQIAVRLMSFIFGKNAWQGAQTSIHLAVTKISKKCKSKVNGKLFVDCKAKFWFDFLIPRVCGDPLACESVYEETIRALGV